jgi:tRNA (guanine-N7-)-methyltransferase
MNVRRGKRLPVEALAPYLLEMPEQSGVLSWPAVFGNGLPVEVEVGCGKGLFLLTSSQARPEVNFLGIEIFRKYQLYVATRLAKRGIRNVKLLGGDAREFLAKHVPPESLQAIHVYFPDPWWKKRHLKRRLFTPQFAAACERGLQASGRLFIATDVECYFQIIGDIMARHAQLILEAMPDEKTPSHDFDYLTNFERKYRKAGKAIYRAVYRR